MRILFAALVTLGLATASAYAKPAEAAHAPAYNQTTGIGWG